MTAPNRDGRPGDLREAVEAAALAAVSKAAVTWGMPLLDILNGHGHDHDCDAVVTDNVSMCDCWWGEVKQAAEAMSTIATLADEQLATTTPTAAPTEVAVEEREALAEALTVGIWGDEHIRAAVIEARRQDADRILASDWLRDHDAALTAKAKAEAWDEGRRFGQVHWATNYAPEVPGKPDPNPYRADRSER